MEVPWESTPLTSGFKIDLNELTMRKLNIEMIGTTDGSQLMICVAIYARFRRKSGGCSCQLVFARSNVVPKDMTMPREELMAAAMNANAGYVVKMAFGEFHIKCWKISDSQLALHWIGCTKSKNVGSGRRGRRDGEDGGTG